MKTTQSPVTLASLKDQVRLIHALQPETLLIHQHYFHANLEAFLQKATIQSLQLYIQHYLPVIKRSIRICPDSLHEESVNDEHYELPPVDSNLPSSVAHGQCPIIATHPAQAEPSHRKCNRPRILQRMRQVLIDWSQRPQHFSSS